jgi:hypothetical protein
MWPDSSDEEPDDESGHARGQLVASATQHMENTSVMEIFDLFDISDEIRTAYFALKQ